MAARKDAWLAELEQAFSPALLDTLFETSVPGLEARLSALLRVPPHKKIAAAAVTFFERFPVRFREALSCAAVAAGVAVVHHAKFPAKVRPPTTPNAHVPTWHLQVTTALRKVLRAYIESGDVEDGKPMFPTDRGSPSRPVASQIWLSQCSSELPASAPA
jgi:hypothetical protein